MEKQKQNTTFVFEAFDYWFPRSVYVLTLIYYVLGQASVLQYSVSSNSVPGGHSSPPN